MKLKTNKQLGGSGKGWHNDSIPHSIARKFSSIGRGDKKELLDLAKSREEFLPKGYKHTLIQDPEDKHNYILYGKLPDTKSTITPREAKKILYKQGPEGKDYYNEALESHDRKYFGEIIKTKKELSKDLRLWKSLQ